MNLCLVKLKIRSRLAVLVVATIVNYTLMMSAGEASEDGFVSGPGVPGLILGLNLQTTPFADEAEETRLVGLDADLGGYFHKSNQWAWALNVGAQEQQLHDIEITRYVAGLAGYYFPNRGNGSVVKPFFGVKRTYYWGEGATQDDYACRRCSDINKSYYGGNFFGVVGLRFSAHGVLKIECRLSDERSRYTRSTYHPFRDVQSYSDIPDPKVIVSVGYWALDSL